MARSLLDVPSIEHIDQVELDPEMIEMSKTEPHVLLQPGFVL
ncbi:MAG: hypothetical protein R3B54_13150 [Bdellovibrionota bacterium]